MRAILIDAQGAGSVGRAVVEWIPAGLRAIAGILEDRGIEYDLALVEEFLKNPALTDYDVAMITGMSSDFEMIRTAGERIKGLNRPFVVGGPVTFDPCMIINHAKADIAIIGEGEKSFSGLLDEGLKDGAIPEEESLKEIGGIAFKDKDGTVNVKMPSHYLTKAELSRFFPSVEIIKSYPFHEEIMVVMEILRGCSNFHKPKEYHGKTCDPSCNRCESEDLSLRLSCPMGTPGGCGFCSVGGLYGPPRSREQETIIREIKGLIENGATKITILDPDPLDYKRDELVAPMPLTSPEWPMPNYEELERLGDMIWDIPDVSSEEVVVTVRDVKATLVTDRSVEILKRYFPRSVFGIGCETGSKEHSSKLGRPYKPEKVLSAAKVFHKHGIKPKINMIVGLPWQDEETTKETLELMKRLEPHVSHFDFTRFESLPMSGFDDHPSDTGPLTDENSRRLLERSNAIQKSLFERFIGERLKVVAGRYPEGRQLKGRSKERTPRRGFRKLAGIVGYPIFDKRQLSLYATVVKIRDGTGEAVATGDIVMVEIDGVSQVGFRLVLEGTIIGQISS
ncbi:MAG: B12-binding domain-containing radical SAM protein [Candidatus Hydrothermarchaeales archaeon]